MDAENKILHLKAAAAGVIAIFTALWGWFGWVVLVWVALMLADWLVGSAVAAKEGCWSSAKMREGAWHKGGMLLVVCVALTADWLVGSILGNLPGITLPFTYSVLIGPLVIVSRPARGAWIEIVSSSSAFSFLCCRAPRGARGLK